MFGWTYWAGLESQFGVSEIVPARGEEFNEIVAAEIADEIRNIAAHMVGGWRTGPRTSCTLAQVCIRATAIPRRHAAIGRARAYYAGSTWA